MTVNNVFDRVASKYDLMNDVMSFGLHRLWKDYAVDKLHFFNGMKLLDVAGGTGDMAFRFSDRMKGFSDCSLKVLDINKEMLFLGQSRAATMHHQNIEWIEGDAQKLPFDDNSFDAYCIAFGLRNVPDINLALLESWRVLKPGGKLLCLELSHPPNPLISQLYDVFSFQLIPVFGQLIVGDPRPYQYLIESIRKFPRQDELAEIMSAAGFSFVQYDNLNAGIVAVHTGIKAEPQKKN